MGKKKLQLIYIDVAEVQNFYLMVKKIHFRSIIICEIHVIPMNIDLYN